jgi:hypothetical protein
MITTFSCLETPLKPAVGSSLGDIDAYLTIVHAPLFGAFRILYNLGPRVRTLNLDFAPKLF